MPSKVPGASLLLATLLVSSGQAEAAALSFTGELSIRLGIWTPAIVAMGSGVAQVNGGGPLGHLSQLVLSPSAFGPVTSAVVTVGASHHTFEVVGFANQGGSFTLSSSGGPSGGGIMGVSGIARLCIFAACPIITIPLPIAATANGGLGVGGTQTASNFAHSVTVQHAAWELGATVVTWHGFLSATNTTTTTGFAHGATSGTSDTAQPSGVLQLVTTSKVWTNSSGAYPELPIVSTLTLHFVPEPRAAMLVALGLAVLVARRRARAR